MKKKMRVVSEQEVEVCSKCKNKRATRIISFRVWFIGDDGGALEPDEPACIENQSICDTCLAVIRNAFTLRQRKARGEKK